MKFRFVEPNSEEFRELLYNRLREIIVGIKSGLYTYNDLFFTLIAELQFGSLTREQVNALLKSPALQSLDAIFSKTTLYEIDNVKLSSPVLVVTPDRNTAVKLLQSYSFLTPFTDVANIEYTVVSAYKAISELVKGIEQKVPDIKIFIYRPHTWRPRKQVNALKTLVLLCRLANVSVLSNPQIVLDAEAKALVENSSGRLRALMEELLESVQDYMTISLRDISEDFRPAIAEFLRRRDWQEELCSKLEQLSGLRCSELPIDSAWWCFGNTPREVDKEKYELAKKLGFDDRTARKIASWKVESINDVVRLLRDLAYSYRDVEYFRSSVVPKIAQIFNMKTEILLHLLEII